MKKLALVFMGCSLAFGFFAAAEPSETDQKWLQAVEKMVTKGEKKISTPVEARVTLFKDWAEKNGYSVKVTKSEQGFGIEVTGKSVAQK